MNPASPGSVTRALACVLLAVGLSAAATPAWDGNPVSGMVRDPVGSALSNVEVFFVRVPDGKEPAATAMTDPVGRYVVSDLLPGVYRVAAVKQGYGLYLGRINTAMRSTLDVVLRPLPQPGEPGFEAIAKDASWSLRVPRRSAWHETSAEALRATDFKSSGTRDDALVVDEILNGRVEQVFALAAPQFATGDGGTYGSETRMELAGLVGENARLSFGGFHANYDDAGDEGSVAPRTNHDATAVNLGVAYDTGRDMSFDVQAFYAQRGYDVALHSGESYGDAVQHASQSWGYDAAWKTRLDPTSVLALKMDYRDATLDLPVAVGGSPGGQAPAALMRNLAIGAGGSYESVPHPEHQVRVGFHARFVDVPSSTVRGVPSGAPVLESNEVGWNLHIEADDAWRVAAPVTVLYGMGYRHVLADRESAVAVPRVGGAWTHGRISMRAVASYYLAEVRDAVAPAGQVDVVATAGAEPSASASYETGWGYDAIVETALPAGFRLQGGASFVPIQNAPIGYRPGAEASVSQPLYLSSGHASVQEMSATLRHASRSLSGYVQYAHGAIQGTVASVLPYQTPYHTLGQSEIDYASGRFGLRVPSSGTDLQMEFRRMHEIVEDSLGSPLTQEQISLRLLQNLLRMHRGQTWRLLVAVQTASMERDAEAIAARPELRVTPDTLHRVNAGVSVAF